ncbi:uncharacterized protein [Porites lutea]|uniref:uncharacterized protein n=1 Tax=Porites lutea TaxID=51062 RepID=UPI003CC6037C
MVTNHSLLKGSIVFSTWLVIIIRGAVINPPPKDGTFKITGKGIEGEGTFAESNGKAEIGLHIALTGQGSQAQLVVPAPVQADKGEPESTFRTTNGNDNTETEITFTQDDEDFLDQMLEEHNKLRSVHLAPPLEKNRNMSLQAKTLAVQLATEANLRHSDKASRPDQGENLAMGCTSSGPGITAKDAAKEWYDEVCSHNFYDQAYQDRSGHFSQLVWNATRELGVGRAIGQKFGMNCTFIVARYRPLGNIGSEFASDVTKGNFDSSYCSHVQRDSLPRLGEPKSKIGARKGRYRARIPHIPKIVIL